MWLDLGFVKSTWQIIFKPRVISTVHLKCHTLLSQSFTEIFRKNTKTWPVAKESGELVTVAVWLGKY